MQRLLQSIDADGDGRVHFEDMRRAMATHAFYRLRVGRYLVAVSLAEAESLRAAMHAAQPRDAGSTLEGHGGRLPQAPQAELALRHRGEVLDCTMGFLPGGVVGSVSGDYLSAIGEQCYRFLDSQLDFEPEALAMLLRALQVHTYMHICMHMHACVYAHACIRACIRACSCVHTRMGLSRCLLCTLQGSPMDQRLSAFIGVRHCRRRAVVDWKMFTIGRLFTTEDG